MQGSQENDFTAIRVNRLVPSVLISKDLNSPLFPICDSECGAGRNFAARKRLPQTLSIPRHLCRNGNTGVFFAEADLDRGKHLAGVPILRVENFLQAYLIGKDCVANPVGGHMLESNEPVSARNDSSVQLAVRRILLAGSLGRFAWALVPRRRRK